MRMGQGSETSMGQGSGIRMKSSQTDNHRSPPISVITHHAPSQSTVHLTGRHKSPPTHLRRKANEVGGRVSGRCAWKPPTAVQSRSSIRQRHGQSNTGITCHRRPPSPTHLCGEADEVGGRVLVAVELHEEALRVDRLAAASGAHEQQRVPECAQVGSGVCVQRHWSFNPMCGVQTCSVGHINRCETPPTHLCSTAVRSR